MKHYYDSPTMQRISILLALSGLAQQSDVICAFLLHVRHQYRQLGTTTTFLKVGRPTELPDSLQDAAERAAEASAQFAEEVGVLARCRVDFDTSIGDETYTLLKSSTEFMQHFVSALSYALIPGLQEARQAEMMRVATAKGELKTLKESEKVDQPKEEQLLKTIANGGRDEEPKWQGPVARVYFPDEGSAALARRDWFGGVRGGEAKVPRCVQFSSCGGIQTVNNIKNDMVVFFFCPKASEVDSVEEILRRTETESETLKLIVFVNPSLVNMGVTGFGYAARLLRERLIDTLETTYYLRTLAWGALTRQFPETYSVWQEDSNAAGGYRLIKTLDRLPSNPEVEDIFDLANGNMREKSNGGFLDQLGDFVNGMTRL
jgi:hypothetical protein